MRKASGLCHSPRGHDGAGNLFFPASAGADSWSLLLFEGTPVHMPCRFPQDEDDSAPPKITPHFVAPAPEKRTAKEFVSQGLTGDAKPRKRPPLILWRP